MDYDIIFLGGGPAGYEGSIAAGKKGLKVAVVEYDKLGGTCLQRGCVPSKALLHSVKIIKQVKSAKKLGISIGDVSVNIDALKKQKNRVVAKLTKGIELLFTRNNVALINGKGKITGPNTVLVDNQREITGKNIVVATGSKSAELPFLKPDGQFIINSDGALELNDVPEKLLVVGAGAIGLELGQIYSYLGSAVTVVEILDYIVPGSDSELSEILKTELKKQKIKIHTSTAISNPEINRDNNTISLNFQNDNKEWQEEFSKVLLSVGRLPNTDGVLDGGLGIKKDGKGFIEVNKNLQTAVQNIYACGDVVAGPLLAHRASHQAEAIVDHVFSGKEINHHPVPGAVYTFPEFASVGITEDLAKEHNLNYKVGKFPYSAGSRSNAIEEKVGMVKVIADENNRLIGAHIVGSEAGELMPVLTYGVSKKLKADEFKELIFIHPTLSENIWEALGEVAGFSIHI